MKGKGLPGRSSLPHLVPVSKPLSNPIRSWEFDTSPLAVSGFMIGRKRPYVPLSFLQMGDGIESKINSS